MTSLLELNIQIILNRFPNGITVGSDDHSTTNRAVIGELSVGNDVEVPSIEVLRPRRYGSVLNSGLLVRAFAGFRRNLFLGSALGGEIGGSERPQREAEAVVAPENRRRAEASGGGRGGGEYGGERR